MDLGKRLLHQQDRQVSPVHVQPADEVASLIHALDFYFHLGTKDRCVSTCGGRSACVRVGSGTKALKPQSPLHSSYAAEAARTGSPE